MSKQISAVIMAGRENRHLKMPKQVFPFGDSTVLNRTLQAYLDAGMHEVILVLGHRAAEVRETLGPLESKVRVMIPPNPESGFGVLLKHGVGAVSGGAKAFAIGLGDQPLLEASLIQQLAERFTEGKHKILVPVCQGKLGHPVFFAPALAGDFAALGPNGEIWDVLKAHPTEVHDYHLYSTVVIRDIDDLDDYHAMLQLAGLPIPEVPTVRRELEEVEEMEAQTSDQGPSSPSLTSNGGE